MTRGITSLGDVVDRLRHVPPDEVAAFATDFLREPYDWAGMARAFLTEVDDDAFVETVLKEHIKDVEPRIFMLHDEPGHFQIILHHFDRAAFDEHWDARRLGPHYHHFSFSTRIIKGSYFHWLFDNSGTLDRPELTPRRQARDTVADVYLMPWDQFHCVMAPEHGSMSFMIRGPAVLDPKHEPDVNYTPGMILEAKDMLVRTLAEAPPPSVGRLARFDDMHVEV